MAGTARDVYRQLRGFSVDGVAVLVVRHSRKARGGIAETAAGSVAFSGEADQLVRFTKPSVTSELRRVEIVGRIGDSVTFNVEMTEAGWAKVPDKNDGERVADGHVQGTKRFTAKDAVVKVLAAMGRTGATQAEIVAEIVKRSKSDGGRAYTASAIYGALQALLKGDIVDKDDRHPLHYHLRIPSIHSSPVGGENE